MKQTQSTLEESTLLQSTNPKHHLIQYKFYYLGITILFFLGFFIGSFYSNTLSAEEFSVAKENAQAFLSSAKQNTLDYRLILWEDFAPCLKIFFASLALLGGLGTLYFLFQAGFSAGFFLAFLTKAFLLKGFFLGSIYLLCLLLFTFPALLFLSFRSLRCSLFFLRCTLQFSPGKQTLKSELFLLVTALLVSGILLVSGAFFKFRLLPPLCRYLFA